MLTRGKVVSPEVNITLSIPRSFAWQSAKFWREGTGRAEILARFWSHVNRAKAKGDDCWPWRGGTNNRGYGLFYVEGTQRIKAHRLVWLIARGDIPAGLVIRHRCENSLCVNPAHLELGTQQQNIHDSVRSGRKKAWGLQKLTARQVQEIRARVSAGALQKDVARIFGISRNHVSTIVNGKAWGHLPVHESASPLGNLCADHGRSVPSAGAGHQQKKVC